MPLAQGTRLGPYAIEAPLGAGGMGQVYAAADTRLHRRVAIKVLAAGMAGDPTLTMRFEREAQAIAALNHPHICTLYDVGHHDGIDYLVMELVEGQSLADRIAAGALPLDQALACAIQIADALDAAHTRGIVHRDLKPGNVMLTKDGAKLLDFGLAKLREAAPQAAADLRTAVTGNLTMQGTILGTIAYMPPEQLEGGEPDARSDLFALGCVIYEMVTGERPFAGDSQASIIGAILLVAPPPLTSRNPLLPATLESAVMRCLAKHPDDRWQSAGELRGQLKWIAAERRTQSGAGLPVASSSATPPSQVTPLPARASGAGSRLSSLAWAGGAAVLAAAVTAAAAWQLGGSPPPRDAVRFVVNVPPGAQSAGRAGMNLLALSPSGRILVFAAIRSGVPVLYRRDLGQLTAEPIPGTEGGVQPFFSPDGQWVGFFDADDLTLKKVALAGGSPVAVQAIKAQLHGAAWLDNDTIVFGKHLAPLSRVSASGGEATPLTTLEEGEEDHTVGVFTPGQGAVPFMIAYTDRARPAKVAVHLMASGARQVLVDGSHPMLTAAGRLIVARDGVLWSAPFDRVTGRTTAEPAPLVDGVQQLSSVVQASVGGHALAYAPGHAVSNEAAGLLSMVFVDASGAEQRLSLEDRPYAFPRVSPAGDRVAVRVQRERTTQGDLWVYDLRTGAALRLTHQAENRLPIWSPDGKYIFYSSTAGRPAPDGQAATFNVYRVPSDGSGQPERLTTGDRSEQITGISPDGKMLLFTRTVGARQWEVISAPSSGPGETHAILSGMFRRGSAELSPDGKWLLYRSDDSGAFEIYLQPYPGPGPKVPVSIGGRRFAALVA